MTLCALLRLVAELLMEQAIEDARKKAHALLLDAAGLGFEAVVQAQRVYQAVRGRR